MACVSHWESIQFGFFREARRHRSQNNRKDGGGADQLKRFFSHISGFLSQRFQFNSSSGRPGASAFLIAANPSRIQDR
jgi:hypothetical protein